VADLWASADAYELYMARWSTGVAARFLEWLALPAGLSWLDVGCGTGALTQAILSQAPARVVGLEPSKAFIARARERVAGDRAGFVQGSADDIAQLGTFDAVVAGLVLNFLPDARAALRGMAEATAAGGTVAAYVWDYADGMQPMRHFWDAATELDPTAAALDEGRRATLCNPGALTELFSAELPDVEVTALVVPTHFASFDDYWLPFLGGVGSAPAYATGLSTDARNRLQQRLRERLPSLPDGSIRLEARAWAVKGRKT
jgi:SAM-dependent methyltransferase